jgi:hypothetical protein
MAEQKNNSIQNSDQPQVVATAPTQAKSFSPAIIETKQAVQPVTSLTELYVTEPVFNTPAGDAIQPDLSLNNSISAITWQNVVDPVASHKNEMAENFFPQTDLNILKQSSFVKTEDNGLNDVSIGEKNITGESPVDNSTEKKINEAVSALASQNILLPKPDRQARVTAQVYFTPTVSYRKLTENLPGVDLKNVVKHKPAMGLEFGIEGRYRTSERFSLKTGLQFNINRYDIRAYSHPREIATVALSSGFGSIDSLFTMSDYRIFRGGTSPNSNWLENFYFQVAVPVGAEFIISDHNNIQWGVSGTIQPTYVIGDKAYAISSDYKNYAEFPDLMRRWNISTGVGTFVSYSTGRIRWQVGPHLRYQHLSSFVSTYNVKEKLYAVGLKVGATLNK